MFEWFDSHHGSILAAATIVLVLATGYLAFVTLSLVRESHATLQAQARSTLQARMDRISEICIREPALFSGFDDETATGEEQDGRFHLANMLLGVLEEAHTQYRLERSMPAEDWAAWEATADMVLPRVFIKRYWQRAAPAFEPGFRRYVDERIRAAENAKTQA